MATLIEFDKYKKPTLEEPEPLPMLRVTRSEKTHKCYIFSDLEDTTFKLLSKLTRYGAIFYVLYYEEDESDGEKCKFYVTADVVYSQRNFSRRINDLRRRFNLKKLYSFSF